MKEYLKKGGIVLSACLVIGLIYKMIQMKIENRAASIGIIGGADGPTAIFVTTKTPLISQIWIGCVVIMSCLVIGIVIKYRRNK